MDLGEAFADLYDRLEALSPVATQLEAWPTTEAFNRARLAMAGAIAADATVDDRVVTLTLAGSASELFGALFALDTLLGAANHAIPPAAPAASALHSRRMSDGAYFSSATKGAVLARRGWARKPQVGQEVLSDAFTVLRVSARTWNSTHFMPVDPTQDHVAGPGDQLHLAAVPMGAKSSDVSMTSTSTSANRQIYIAEPASALGARVGKASQALAGAHIGLVPEVTLDPTILERWQRQAHPDAPRWVFVGTGPVVAGDPSLGASAPLGTMKSKAGAPLNPNRGVLIDGRSGALLAVQDKRAGFTILPNLLGSYGLQGAPATPHDEGMEPGNRITVLESAAGRFAVSICEDLGREIDLSGQLVELGITHLLVPILATPMEGYRWQHLSAAHLAQRSGTTTVVFNSLTFGRFEKNTNAPSKTLLLVEHDPDAYLPNPEWTCNPAAAAMASVADALTARTATTRAR